MPPLAEEEIRVSKTAEFFISIAKQGIHSFVMLGVVQEDGAPRLLARVGKTNYVDPDVHSQAKLTLKAVVGHGTLAFLGDEGVSRDATYRVSIQHQSYSLTYEQAKQCLSLLYEIEVQQHSDIAMRKALVRGQAVSKNNHILVEAIDNFEHDDPTSIPGFIEMEKSMRISCFVPAQEEEQNVTFKMKRLIDFFQQTGGPAREPVSEKAAIAIAIAISTTNTITNTIKLSNTCRTTAVNILESVLGFKTSISRYFFVSPKHQAILTGGQPEKPFFILPPPPTAYPDSSEKQKSVLLKLYERLEQIPKKHVHAQDTIDKFEGLKALYKSIAGPSHLGANELLGKILGHEAASIKLFIKRAPCYLSKLLSIQSTTERVFHKIKTDLQKDIDSLKDSEKKSNDDPSLRPIS